MNPTARSSRLVSGLAVAAVCLVAMAAMWADRGRPAESTVAAAAQRPAADAPVRVVKAPPATRVLRQPAHCEDCPAPQLREHTL